MKTVLVTSSTGEPITLEDLKAHLRIMPGETEDDEYLRVLISMSREYVEEVTNKKLMPQTWKLYIDAWPGSDYIQLPYGKVRSVPSTGIVYTNSTGDSTTFSSTAWSASTASNPGRVYLKYDSDWPTVTLDNKDPISVEFRCGYSTRAAIPASIKHAMKIICADHYETRESIVTGMTVTASIPIVKALLQPHRNFTF